MKTSSRFVLLSVLAGLSSLTSGFVPMAFRGNSIMSGSTRLNAFPTKPTSTESLLDSTRVQEESPTLDKWRSTISDTILGTLLMFSMSSSPLLIQPQAAYAEGSTIVGKLQGSGLVFKDILQIQRFEDPKIRGVELYISNFDRPITEKFSGGNLFNDPAYASVACAKTSKVVAIADNIAKGPGGEEVFEESRSLLFKTLRVQRIYDTETNTVIYVSYNTRLDKNDDTNKSRFKSSLCAVNLNDS